ncbi:MAG: ParB/RepB/Spo0J family partition protein [Candidatus Kerfeldbacteria bacterium]|nr:ParB/RepB/Spo0J family partition protein [Candidatus Kerfeldbacteria bacterium]
MTDAKPLGRGLGSLIPRKLGGASSRPTSPDPSLIPAKTGKEGGRATPPNLPAAEGRGLGTKPATNLTLPSDLPRPSSARSELTASLKHKVLDIPISLIVPNPHQPRHRIQDEDLEDLVSSIRQHGILQPLIVTKVGNGYQLIAGERRFRSAIKLGLATVPAIVRETKELEQLEIAIVENVQREDLNPIEEATAYQQLAEEFGLTQEDIARKVGKRRTTVANALRLLTLPLEMQQALRRGNLSASHAKILLSAVTPSERQHLYEQIITQGLPVRAAAELGQTTTVRRHARRPVDALTRSAEDELRQGLGTKVTISKRDHRGSIRIEFYSEEEYQNLLQRFRHVSSPLNE